MWYLYIAAGTGVVFEWMRPAKFDNVSMFTKILVPTVAGLLWPIMLGWLIIEIIRRW